MTAVPSRTATCRRRWRPLVRRLGRVAPPRQKKLLVQKGPPAKLKIVGGALVGLSQAQPSCLFPSCEGWPSPPSPCPTRPAGRHCIWLLSLLQGHLQRLRLARSRFRSTSTPTGACPRAPSRDGRPPELRVPTACSLGASHHPGRRAPGAAIVTSTACSGGTPWPGPLCLRQESLRLRWRGTPQQVERPRQDDDRRPQDRVA